MGHPYWRFRALVGITFVLAGIRTTIQCPPVRSNLRAGIWKDAEVITRFNLEPFASPGYRRYFLATALVALALWIYQPALEWIVLIETGRAAAVGLLQTALIVSIALATLPSGLLTARYGPRRTLTASILGLAGMVGLIALVAALDRLTFEVALVLSFATGLFDGLFSVPAALLVAQVGRPPVHRRRHRPELPHERSRAARRRTPRRHGAPAGRAGAGVSSGGAHPRGRGVRHLHPAGSGHADHPRLGRWPRRPPRRRAVASRQQANPGRHGPRHAVRRVDLRLLRAPAGFHAGRAAGRTRDPRPAERCRRRGLDRRSAGNGAGGPATRTRTPGRGDVRRLAGSPWERWA